MPRALNSERINNPQPADPRFPADAQFDLIVEGSSLDKLAREGDLIRCVDLERAGIGIANGDIVVIERRRGEGAELLAKRVLKQGEAIEFWSESTLDYWREPVIRQSWNGCSAPEMRIVAKVLYAYPKR